MSKIIPTWYAYAKTQMQSQASFYRKDKFKEEQVIDGEIYRLRGPATASESDYVAGSYLRHHPPKGSMHFFRPNVYLMFAHAEMMFRKLWLRRDDNSIWIYDAPPLDYPEHYVRRFIIMNGAGEIKNMSNGEITQIGSPRNPNKFFDTNELRCFLWRDPNLHLEFNLMEGSYYNIVYTYNGEYLSGGKEKPLIKIRSFPQSDSAFFGDMFTDGQQCDDVVRLADG